MSNVDHGLLAEFLRRLGLQLELAMAHARVCEKPKGVMCQTSNLIHRAIKSTVGDLRGMGYGREAADMLRSVTSRHVGTDAED